MRNLTRCVFVLLLMVMVISGCDHKQQRHDLSGKWMVVKAELDGYEITDRYIRPEAAWINFETNGTLLAGRKYTDHSGSWSLNEKNKLSIRSSSSLWDNTTWNVSMIDSVLYLHGTRLTNNYTHRIWLIPSTSDLPAYRKYSEHDEKIMGTWKLLRVKMNSRLVTNQDPDDEIKPEITFLKSGTYKSNLPGEDANANEGVWNINEGDFTLTFFPFNVGQNKQWSYSFTGNLLRLSTIESHGKRSQEWEWVWEKQLDKPSNHTSSL